jgi:DNA-binding NtrC family response regulator
MIRIIIADDDNNLLRVLSTELTDNGYNVTAVDSGSEAVKRIRQHEYDVLLLDLGLPGLGGMGVLKEVISYDSPPEVIILTGNATVATAVESMRLGAYDYLTKPFKIEELKAVIEKAYEKRKLISENIRLKAQLQRQTGQKKIITNNPAMLKLIENAKRLAPSDLPVLIHGESGVGKELVAWLLHESSGSPGAFLPVNCGAIPETMLESELFGHEKGSFTGAYVKKTGLLEVADKGALFLDEVGELPPQLQVKLLRVIETKRFFRVGGVREIQVAVRFIFATNKDLKNEAENGRFRPDLYYRISALNLLIPPLRKRKGDIPLLVEYFMKTNPSFRNKSFTDESLALLQDYPWPGNIRELQNLVYRVLLLSKSDLIGPNDLPADFLDNYRLSGNSLKDVEKRHILKVLDEAGGRRSRAAEILDIDPKTLYRKLLSYGMKE